MTRSYRHRPAQTDTAQESPARYIGDTALHPTGIEIRSTRLVIGQLRDLLFDEADDLPVA